MKEQIMIEINEFQLDIICEALETYASKAYWEHLRFDYSSCKDVFNYLIGLKYLNYERTNNN